MKSINSISLMLAGSLLVASCTTYSQTSAGLTGAMIGSHIGRDIGFLTSGPRHFGGRNAAIGSLIGAGIGAALGVGIQSSVEKSEEQKNHERAYIEPSNDTRSYYSDNVSNNGFGSNTFNTGSVSNSLVTVDRLSYMDGDGDGYMSKGETIEVETYITNRTDSTIQNVTITLGSLDNNVALSSPLVTTLSPGQKVRYTGRIYCQKAKKNNAVQVSVNVNAGGQNLNTSALPIYMK